jgi:hypothetical protein
MTGISAAEYDAMVAKTMTEKQLQAAIVGAAQRLNWLVYHTHDSRRSQPGFPDLVLELKTMRGKVTTEQQQWLDALTNAGQDAAVWRPNDWLGTTIQDTLYPPSGGTQ